MLLELSKMLNVTPKAVSKRLHVMEKIHKEGIWLPHELSENAILNCLSIASSLFARQKKKEFLWRFVTGNEKWIYFDNSKRKKSWVDPGHHPFQRRKGIFIRPYSAFGGIRRVCCIVNSCVQLRPL